MENVKCKCCTCRKSGGQRSLLSGQGIWELTREGKMCCGAVKGRRRMCTPVNAQVINETEEASRPVCVTPDDVNG